MNPFWERQNYYCKRFIWIAGVMVISFALYMEQIHYLHIKYASMFFSLTFKLYKVHTSTWPQGDCKHKCGQWNRMAIRWPSEWKHSHSRISDSGQCVQEPFPPPTILLSLLPHRCLKKSLLLVIIIVSTKEPWFRRQKT